MLFIDMCKLIINTSKIKLKMKNFHILHIWTEKKIVWMGNVTKVTCDFNLVADLSQFTKDFTENHNEDSDEGYFLEVGFQYPEKLINLLDK